MVRSANSPSLMRPPLNSSVADRVDSTAPAFHECDSFLVGLGRGIHGWGFSGIERKVLHNLPLRTNLLHHNEVLSHMNDGANTPSRPSCPVGKISRTLFNTGLDSFQPAPLDRKSTRLNSSHLGISYA